jgi:hypothetical protein
VWLKDGKRLQNSDEFVIHSDEYQGGALAILQITRTQVKIECSANGFCTHNINNKLT